MKIIKAALKLLGKYQSNFIAEVTENNNKRRNKVVEFKENNSAKILISVNLFFINVI